MHSRSQRIHKQKQNLLLKIIKGIVNNRCTKYPNPTDIEGTPCSGEKLFPKESREKGLRKAIQKKNRYIGELEK
jgi:hypothetical protein